LRYIHYTKKQKKTYMKKTLLIAGILMILSGCDFNPVLTIAKKNETILSPIGFCILMMIIIIFTLKLQKKKKIKKCP